MLRRDGTYILQTRHSGGASAAFVPRTTIVQHGHEMFLKLETLVHATGGGETMDEPDIRGLGSSCQR
jgi:hypothetical protein